MLDLSRLAGASCLLAAALSAQDQPTAQVLVLDLLDDQVVEADFDNPGEIPALPLGFATHGAVHIHRGPQGRTLLTDLLGGRVLELGPDGECAVVLDGLRQPRATRALAGGAMLVAETGAGRVVEYDAEGQRRWEFTADGLEPWDALRTPLGFTLIADRAGERLLKVSHLGDVIWTRPNLGPVKRLAPMRDRDLVLVTVPARGEVLVIANDGTVRLRLSDLRTPRDAVELPDGRLLVATLGALREFRADGKPLRSVPAPLPVALTVARPPQPAGLPRPAAVTPFDFDRGSIWIADYSDNEVVQIDAEGNKLQSLKGIYGPFDVDPLPDGRVLIAEFALSRVLEYAGKEQTWSFEGLRNPYCAERLSNGNTLIADTFGERVLEVDRSGEVVWSLDGEIQPYDVERSADGTTWIADGGRGVVEQYGTDGKLLRRLTGMDSPHDVDVLDDGNLLITMRASHRVVEIDAKSGAQIWELRDLQSPSDADRLPDGTTLVAENGRVARYSRDGERIWEHQVAWALAVEFVPANR